MAFLEADEAARMVKHFRRFYLHLKWLLFTFGVRDFIPPLTHGGSCNTKIPATGWRGGGFQLAICVFGCFAARFESFERTGALISTCGIDFDVGIAASLDLLQIPIASNRHTLDLYQKTDDFCHIVNGRYSPIDDAAAITAMIGIAWENACFVQHGFCPDLN